jgi:hypothetical protein
VKGVTKVRGGLLVSRSVVAVTLKIGPGSVEILDRCPVLLYTGGKVRQSGFGYSGEKSRESCY